MDIFIKKGLITMEVYILIYVIIGLISGFIGIDTVQKKNWSFGLMIIGTLVSLITFGPYVIAAIIEMAIGFYIAILIRKNQEYVLKIIGLVIFFICIYWITGNSTSDSNSVTNSVTNSDLSKSHNFGDCDMTSGHFDEDECYKSGGTPYIDD